MSLFTPGFCEYMDRADRKAAEHIQEKTGLGRGEALLLAEEIHMIIAQEQDDYQSEILGWLKEEERALYEARKCRIMRIIRESKD